MELQINRLVVCFILSFCATCCLCLKRVFAGPRPRHTRPFVFAFPLDIHNHLRRHPDIAPALPIAAPERRAGFPVRVPPPEPDMAALEAELLAAAAHRRHLQRVLQQQQGQASGEPIVFNGNGPAVSAAASATPKPPAHEAGAQQLIVPPPYSTAAAASALPPPAYSSLFEGTDHKDGNANASPQPSLSHS